MTFRPSRVAPALALLLVAPAARAETVSPTPTPAIPVVFATPAMPAMPAPRDEVVAHGVVLSRVKPDGVTAKMGLRDGDVVETVDGTPVPDAAAALKALNRMQNDGTLDVRVRRGDDVGTETIDAR